MWISNANIDDTVSWTNLRGDETTTGTSHVDSFFAGYSAVYARHVPGRGSDIIRIITRLGFVFLLGALNPAATISSANIQFYGENRGSTGDSAKIIGVQATALAGTTADFGNCFVADTVAVTHNAPFFGTNF